MKMIDLSNGINPEDNTSVQEIQKTVMAASKFDKKEYKTNYLIDYNTYCIANHLKDADDKKKEKFINDVVTYFRKAAPIDEVINFFNITDVKKEDMNDLRDTINKRNYDVRYIMIGNDPDGRRIQLRMILTFNNGIILPGA